MMLQKAMAQAPFTGVVFVPNTFRFGHLDPWAVRVRA